MYRLPPRPSPSARRKAPTWNLRFPSSTKVPRHTRAISSCLPTSSPGRSTRAVKISSARLPHAQGYRLRAEGAVSEPGGRGRTRSRVRTRRDRSLEPRSIRRVRMRRHPAARRSKSAYTAEVGHERSTTIEQRSDDLRQRVDKPFCFSQIGGAKSFGEPVINRRQQIARLTDAVPVAQQ